MNDMVRRWIGQHAHRLTTTDPHAPLDDLRPLVRLVGDAPVVAIGTATRQSRELSVLAHRVVRLLVEELGFRSFALEGDDAARVGLDAHIAAGKGDARALLAGARSFWQTGEILDIVHWLRSFNRRHPGDPVRFTDGLSAPREPVVPLDGLAAIERRLAEDVIDRHDRTGDRVVYWGGIAHTAVGDPRTVSPSTPPLTHRNAGGYLRERFGTGYVSLGLTFHHGTLPVAVPAPPGEFAESTLGGTGPGAYLLDLRATAPATVRAWLDAPARTRLVGPHYDPADDAAHHLSGGSLAGWFDAVVHTETVTPARPLPPVPGT
ncbi:erythromycin esterase family protein [Streptomyces sp. NPDC059853]|uniref:erythromycin esterase family protein n=1 Tax=Streptomyces sp. NPDC059853 TaxID=3346973 RepID=UPI0036511FE3